MDTAGGVLASLSDPPPPPPPPPPQFERRIIVDSTMINRDIPHALIVDIKTPL
jgi:hypothetical protein